ncbi:MAG TPA: ABC transporter permease [Bryobacteraceae bacterium]|jgi:predicted permease|nr:ABC transporter permease [Bryobacteraceae bacterium]
MTGLYEDFRFGLRALAKYRRFTAVCILSLALGIGANTTIFTLVNAVLLRPLPVPHPETLLAMYTLDSRNPGDWGNSYPNYRDFRDRNPVFSSLLVYTGVGINLTGGAEPHLVVGQLASGNYFSTLGINPLIGRGFLPEEDSPSGASQVAVISYRFWQQEYAGDPNVLSRKLSLNGRDFRIIGVAPNRFLGLDTLEASDIWVPMELYRDFYPAPAYLNQRRYLVLSVVGRLKPGISLPQAQTSMRTIAQDLAREYPADNQNRRPLLTPATDASIPPDYRAQIQRAANVLLAISTLVLIIACGNLASLLLARAAGRRKEIALRLALGANRRRLVRQLLTESVLLAVLGGAAGLAIAILARDLLWSMRPPMFLHAAAKVSLDGNVLAYNFAISVLTGLIFGLVPALRATNPDLANDLKERSGQAHFTGAWNPRSMLVMAQVAFAVVALVGAGLFVRSLRKAMRFDPGFDLDHLGIIVFNFADHGYTPAQGRDFQRRALELARSTPGVAAATLSNDWPFRVSLSRTMSIPGRDTPGQIVLSEFVAPGFLQTEGIPLLRGRDFNDQDGAKNPHVVIVNQDAADRYWPGKDPLGQHVSFYGETGEAEVVGVARTANYRAIGEKPEPFLYFALPQYYFPVSVLTVRTAGEPGAVLPTVRREVQGIDRNLLLQAETVTTTIGQSLWAQRLSAGLLAVFGGVALLLATIGIYGVVSYLVAHRVREFGIRMALGATATDVQLMLLREGVRLVSVGVVVGLGVALIGSRAVESMLFLVTSRDAMTFILVPAILTLVAVLACWIPAQRATRVDPMVALRED